MNNLIKYSMLITLFSINIFAVEDVEEISVFKAKNHIGEYKIVCGKVKSTFLNRKIKGVPLYFNFARESTIYLDVSGNSTSYNRPGEIGSLLYYWFEDEGIFGFKNMEQYFNNINIYLGMEN